MTYFFPVIKIIFKKVFQVYFLTKINPTSKWTFFSRKKLKFEFYVFLHLYNYYNLNYIFFEKLKSSHFLTQKKSNFKIYFSKKMSI